MSLRALAFLLPQFHPIPENDQAWGKGFTEWRNVASAKPLFKDHYQPRLPADLGFYDLRLPEARQAQADLAKAYGVGGFCYYHYWFNGRRVLNQPIDEIRDSGSPDFPFCLCWANENWTRAWDGRDNETIIRQSYSEEDDLNHIRWLCPLFNDPRYIRINGKPLFVVYRVEDLPAPKRTAHIWRQEARRAGIGEIYLVFVENFRAAAVSPKKINPDEIDFDASIEFAPSFHGYGQRRPLHIRIRQKLNRMGVVSGGLHTHHFRNYSDLVKEVIRRPSPGYKQFPCVMTGWDNSSRRKEGATIFWGESPEIYEQWLGIAAQKAKSAFNGDEQLLFINAWNEWAEGTHLEPCAKWGHSYLKATQRVLKTTL